jgi:hypothetical protein
MTECLRCGRPLGKEDTYSSDPNIAFAQCFGEGDIWCIAFVRGLREGVTLAKEEAHADIEYRNPYSDEPSPCIDWSYLDAELARRLN